MKDSRAAEQAAVEPRWGNQLRVAGCSAESGQTAEQRGWVARQSVVAGAPKEGGFGPAFEVWLRLVRQFSRQPYAEQGEVLKDRQL